METKTQVMVAHLLAKLKISGHVQVYRELYQSVLQLSAETVSLMRERNAMTLTLLTTMDVRLVLRTLGTSALALHVLSSAETELYTVKRSGSVES